MRSRFIGLASLAALAVAGCGSKADKTQGAADTTAPSGTASADAGAMATPVAGEAAQPAGAQGFVDAAAASDKFEIESSKLAKTMAKDAAVKSFAAMMITDHTKSSADLKAAAGKTTPAPTVAPKLTADQQSMLDSLKAAGAGFDKAYAQAQVTGHEKALALLQGYASNGDSAPLKAFASNTAPKVSQHLQKAKALPQ